MNLMRFPLALAALMSFALGCAAQQQPPKPLQPPNLQQEILGRQQQILQHPQEQLLQAQPQPEPQQPSQPSQSQQPIKCSDFYQAIDGSWKPAHAVMLPTSLVSVDGTSSFWPGAYYSGIDIASFLNNHCR